MGSAWSHGLDAASLGGCVLPSSTASQRLPKVKFMPGNLALPKVSAQSSFKRRAVPKSWNLMQCVPRKRFLLGKRQTCSETRSTKTLSFKGSNQSDSTRACGSLGLSAPPVPAELGRRADGRFLPRGTPWGGGWAPGGEGRGPAPPRAPAACGEGGAGRVRGALPDPPGPPGTPAAPQRPRGLGGSSYLSGVAGAAARARASGAARRAAGGWPQGPRGSAPSIPRPGTAGRSPLALGSAAPPGPAPDGRRREGGTGGRGAGRPAKPAPPAPGSASSPARAAGGGPGERGRAQTCTPPAGGAGAKGKARSPLAPRLSLLRRCPSLLEDH